MRVAINRSFIATTMTALLVSPGFAQDMSRAEKRGEGLLSRHCAMCHAIGRNGSSRIPWHRHFGRCHSAIRLTLFKKA